MMISPMVASLCLTPWTTGPLSRFHRDNNLFSPLLDIVACGHRFCVSFVYNYTGVSDIND